MKLLTQSDDYGFTRGVTCGILDAIENGVVRNTGLFVNMPESEHAASFIQDYPQVCFGIDFNIVSGDPVSDPELLPDLVDQDGHFIRSTVKMADPRFGKEELWPYEQVLTELRAQLKHFVRLAGQPPEYLHGHSISRSSPAYIRAIRTLSEEKRRSVQRRLPQKGEYVLGCQRLQYQAFHGGKAAGNRCTGVCPGTSG